MGYIYIPSTVTEPRVGEPRLVADVPTLSPVIAIFTVNMGIRANPMGGARALRCGVTGNWPNPLVLIYSYVWA